MRLLVAGWHGQLARCLVGAALKRDDVEACAAGRPALDLCEMPTIQRNVADVDPDVIINTAAYTQVDQAETDPEAAYALNRDGAGLLGEAAAARGVPIIHISTDYVFDGTRKGAYLEDDPTNPQGVYGASKLAGEVAVAAANPAHLIIRTAWVHSPYGHNFVKTMLRLAGERDEVRVVDDQVGSPTYAAHLADAVLEVASQLAGDADRSDLWGIYHAAGTGSVSWCGLARRVFEHSATLDGPTARVTAITTAEFPTPARRPANSVLSCHRLERAFGVRLPDWQDGADACVEALLRAE